MKILLKKGLSPIIICLILLFSTPVGAEDSSIDDYARDISRGLGAAGLSVSSPETFTDRVVAFVNHEPVLLSEIEQALFNYQIERHVPRVGDMDELLRQALERWIDERLMETTAEKAGIKIAPEMVDNRVDALFVSLETGVRGRENFNELLKNAGLERGKFRDILRKSERRKLLISAAIASRVTIEDEQVAEFEKKRRLEGKPIVGFEFSHMFLPMSPAATEADWQRATMECHEVRLKSVIDKTSFAREAEKWASARQEQKALGGRMLGSVSPEDMSPELAVEIQKLQPGESTKPIRVGNGMHVIYLENITTSRQLLFTSLYGVERKKWVEELRKSASIQVAVSMTDPSKDEEF